MPQTARGVRRSSTARWQLAALAAALGMLALPGSAATSAPGPVVQNSSLDAPLF